MKLRRQVAFSILLSPDVLVLHSLNIKANSWDGGDDLAELQLVEDGGLAGGIEAHHQDPHVPPPKQLAEEGGEGDAHV